MSLRKKDRTFGITIPSGIYCTVSKLPSGQVDKLPGCQVAKLPSYQDAKFPSSINQSIINQSLIILGATDRPTDGPTDTNYVLRQRQTGTPVNKCDF